MKFVHEIATVLLDIKITRYVGSVSRVTSKNLFFSAFFLRLQQKQQYATSATLSVMDFNENCDANSLGFSNADNVEPWNGVETYAKLDVDMLRLTLAKLEVDMFLLVTLSFLPNASWEPSFSSFLVLPSGKPSTAMEAELSVFFVIGRVYESFLLDTL